jgi:predicted transcriptional regulator
MKKINIRISEDAKFALDNLKNNFGYSTFNQTIKEIYIFFQKNKITPNDTLDSNFFSVLSMLKENLLTEILDIKKFVKSDSQSMRRLLRALEKDHLVKLSTKIHFLTDEARERNEKIKIENTFKKPEVKIENEQLLKKHVPELSILESQQKRIQYMDKTISQQDVNIEIYQKKFKKIFDHYKIEKNTFGKEKIVIEMDREDFEQLFK